MRAERDPKRMVCFMLVALGISGCLVFVSLVMVSICMIYIRVVQGYCYVHGACSSGTPDFPDVLRGTSPFERGTSERFLNVRYANIQRASGKTFQVPRSAEGGPRG